MSGIDIIQWILYANDVVLFYKTVHEAVNLLTIINNTCNGFGLTISFKKTKTEVFNNTELAENESLISIEAEVIDNFQQFTYMGQVITNDKSICFTDHRTDRAMAKIQ